MANSNPVNTGTSFLRKIALIILGLICCFILLEISLRLGGWVFTSLQKYSNYISIKQEGSYRILCLGESTTAGQYPRLLQERLNSRCRQIKFSVIDGGIPAVTTSYILSHIKASIDKYHPQAVVVMMGVNDEDGLASGLEAMVSKKNASRASFKTVKLVKFIWLSIVKRSSHRPKKKDGPVVVPVVDAACVEQGKEYLDLGEYAAAEVKFKEAITINPKNDRAYAYLLWTYSCWNKPAQAEAVFDLALRNNPRNPEAYLWMGFAYRKMGENIKAEELFKKAIEIMPQMESPYIQLYTMYMQDKNFSKAQEVLKKAMRSSVDTVRIRKALSTVSREMGVRASDDEYVAKAYFKMRDVTIASYKELYVVLKKRGVRLVCVQYPMRDIGPLKDIFKAEAEIIFVDNEQIFKEAVRKKGLQVYFSDMFGGDFGHCTEKGNRLLAENIANVILKEIFGK